METEADEEVLSSPTNSSFTEELEANYNPYTENQSSLCHLTSKDIQE
jgi:hypothetical protein